MSDEAHFTLYISVNKQNVQFWGITNSSVACQKPFDESKVNVWYSICSKTVNGPFFFKDDNGKAVTVNSKRYRAMIREFLFLEIRNNSLKRY